MENKADKSFRSQMIWLTFAYLATFAVSAIFLKSQAFSSGGELLTYILILLFFSVLYARILLKSERNREAAETGRLETFGRQAIIEVEKEVGDKKFLAKLDEDTWG